MDWRECCCKQLAKEIRADENMIKSLIKISDNKLKSSEELKINEINCSSIISLAYESLRELLEALSLKKGYKIYNHECYTSFLKEILKESQKGEEFDQIRKIRNAINYYGKEISIKESREIVHRIKNLRKQIQALI